MPADTLAPAVVAPGVPQKSPVAAAPRRRLVVLGAILLLVIAAFLFLMVRGSYSFAVPRRATMLGAMAVAAFAQGVGTVVFHTVTQNRILTPSIMGFDSRSADHTSELPSRGHLVC